MHINDKVSGLINKALTTLTTPVLSVRVCDITHYNILTIG